LAQTVERPEAGCPVIDGTLHGSCLELFFLFSPLLLYFLGLLQKDETRGAYRLVVVLLTSLEASIARGQTANDMKMMQIIENFKTSKTIASGAADSWT
jgi:hypothetical protein